jgi:hypothetical protein
MRGLIFCLLLVGCGGEAVRSEPTPLETECTEHAQCLDYCVPGQSCSRDVTCGFDVGDGVHGWCTIRCATNGVDVGDNRQTCADWGGRCVPIDNAEWCSR